MAVMALRKTLARCLFSSPETHIRAPPNLPSPLRQLLAQRRPMNPALPPDCLPTSAGGRLLDLIRGLGPDRIRLDGLSPPPAAEKVMPERRITVEDARKVLRASQMEAARAKLRAIPRSCISHSEFVKICCDSAGGELGVGIARSLDEAGAVIVLGNAVLLRPEMEIKEGVAKAIENAFPLPLTHLNDPRRKELKEMEEKKAEIDRKAVAQVRTELWSGLGFLVVQTVGLMRLTFWELSWDVMEPICFYLTSVYFMAGYTFFLKTSKDPSFEGFFQSRFATKQKRLMRAYNFDLDRFNELRGALSCPSPPLSEEFASSTLCQCHKKRMLIEAVD